MFIRITLFVLSLATWILSVAVVETRDLGGPEVAVWYTGMVVLMGYATFQLLDYVQPSFTTVYMIGQSCITAIGLTLLAAVCFDWNPRMANKDLAVFTRFAIGLTAVVIATWGIRGMQKWDRWRRAQKRFDRLRQEGHYW